MPACHGCHRDNAAHRRYCGGCGASLIVACLACSFANAIDDRYCGGCGGVVGATEHRAQAAQQAPPPAPDAHELVGLFDRPAAITQPIALPHSGISQDDLDRLFGGGT